MSKLSSSPRPFLYSKQKRYNGVVKRFSQRGFTLVELIIVIAIGGMIVTLAFLGIRQAQRDKLDDARKSDANHYLLAAKQWASENNGFLPASQADADGVTTTYITAGGATFNDPDGTAWNVTYAIGTPGSSQDMFVHNAAVCNGGSIVAGGTRQFAVAVELNNGINYCISN